MKTINQSTWKRREYYEFFSQFDEPFHGIVVDIDCTNAYEYCKLNGNSFYAYYVHKAMKAVNEIDEFRVRLVDNKIVEFDQVHISPTVGREDGSMGFAFMEYCEEFDVFQENIRVETERVKALEGLCLGPCIERLDTIHISAIPWLKFTGLTHARNFKFKDTVPKISFGKCSVVNGKRTMPVAINVHHGLVDGLHVAKFIERFQELLDG